MSTRGRCAGRPPILRTAFARAGRFEFAGVGNFAGSAGVAERSFKASGNWFAGSTCFSDRAPYRARFNVSTTARRFSFSARNAAFNASKCAVSCGEFWPSDMLESYQTCRTFRQKIKACSEVFPPGSRSLPATRSALVSASNPCRQPACAAARYSSVTAPSCTGGQVKPPASSRFVTRQRPEPSQRSSLIRSVRLARKTKISPAKGSADNVCITMATRPSMPLRKSTGLDATITRSPGRDGMPRITVPAQSDQAPDAKPPDRHAFNPDPRAANRNLNRSSRFVTDRRRWRNRPRN